MSAASEGGVYLVTGSTDGIGRHTALKLATSGHAKKVLVHGRSEQRVQSAVRHITDKLNGGGGGQVEVEGYVADISSLKGMKSLADQVSSRNERLDCLINNAGVFEHDFRHSEDGVEYTFAVNVLAPFMLTHWLLPLLRHGGAGKPTAKRIVNVSSISQAYNIDLDNLQFEKGGYSDHRSYSLSKLAMAMFNAELHHRLQATAATTSSSLPTITCNSLDPGTVNTKMLDAGWGMCGIPISSAGDEFYLATSRDVEGVSGKYFVNRRESSGAPPIREPSKRKVLWEYLEKLGGVTDFGKPYVSN